MNLRPLGNSQEMNMNEDYQLFLFDEKLYDSLAEKSEMKYEEEYKKFMGNFYNKIPKPTFKELKELYDYKLDRKVKFEKLNADKLIIEHEEKQIVDLYEKIKRRDYGSYSDPSYKKYREAYEAREKEWHDSDIKKNFLDGIYKSNYDEFTKAKQESA
jgi:hypothetical protein